VRSAVLHAISLARVAVTNGRARAVGHRRLRQRVEIDRLRQEVSLLREELRIKDSRMARVPPPRRHHYLPWSGWRSSSCARRGDGRQSPPPSDSSSHP
jgi:hypothetical protein